MSLVQRDHKLFLKCPVQIKQVSLISQQFAVSTKIDNNYKVTIDPCPNTKTIKKIKIMKHVNFVPEICQKMSKLSWKRKK